MKKITDERLKVRNLKNLRIAFLFENLFLYGVLVWQLINGRSFSAVFDWGNVPFAATLIGGMTLSILSVNVSEPIADKPRVATKHLLGQGAISWLIFAVIFYLIIQNQPLWLRLLLAIGCSFPVAAVYTGVYAYGNHFRSKNSSDED